MGFGFNQSSYDAVLFFDDSKVVKEMLYSEFEAVLDGIVGEPEYAGKTCYAVYLKIDTNLSILGSVFFTIDFDRDGAADKRWNLPLNQLVETAAFGAKLDGIRIRVACRSQCQIPWHQEHLWEPDLSRGTSIFKEMDACIKRNRLGLLIVTDHEPVDSAALHSTSSTAFGKQPMAASNHKLIQEEQEKVQVEERDKERLKMADNIKKQRLYIASVKARHQQELESLRIEFSCEKETLVIQLEDAKLSIETMRKQIVQLNNELDQKQQNFESQKATYEKQLSETLNKQGLDFSVLKKQFRQDLQEKLIEQTGDLQSKLEMREAEVHYREEQIQRINRELEEVRSEMLLKQQSTGVNKIGELSELGVHFVLTLPGIGPINILPEEIPVFSASSSDYIAERLGVELPIYEEWIEHAKHPFCGESLTDDCYCNHPLDIEAPKDFVAGVSDRCMNHRASLAKAAHTR